MPHHDTGIPVLLRDNPQGWWRCVIASALPSSWPDGIIWHERTVILRTLNRCSWLFALW
ncbi:hypothetical protein ACT3I2_07670 [Escherichia coli]|uniref:hypothetical protein n=1 Tax=Escherichia coli TaxID=562 RepID=UPI000ACF7B05